MKPEFGGSVEHQPRRRCRLRSEIVKGYEFAKGQYVMFAPDEIKALEEAGSDAIDIGEFVPLESVDPLYFDRTCYLAPDRGGSRRTAAAQSPTRCSSRRCATASVAPSGGGLRAGATLLFNLAVLLEDRGREAEAMAVHREALEIDPDCADAHFNLARLHELAGNHRDSLRHLLAYR